MHLSTSLVNDQLDAQILYSITRLFQSSTCFEQRCTHHQEVNSINTASVMVTLCHTPSGMEVEQQLDLHTGRSVTESDHTRCCINTLRTGDADLRFYITTVQDG